jgi:hypothetical protein
MSMIGRQKYIQVNQIVPGPSHSEVEIAIAKLKKFKLPCSDQFPAELIQAGGETLVSVIHKQTKKNSVAFSPQENYTD